MTTRRGKRRLRAKSSRSFPARKAFAKPTAYASCDAASAARTLHRLISGEQPPFQTALVVGRDTGSFLRELSRLQPVLRVESSNLELLSPGRPLTWSYSDRQFDLVVALDVIADFPPAIRPGFFRELARVSRRETVCIAPLGTDLHLLIERSLINLSRERFQVVDPELSQRLSYGLPTPQEAFSWIRHGEEADIFYAGDVLAYQHLAERKLMCRTPYAFKILLWHWKQLSTFPDDSPFDQPETVPMRRHRRLFLHLRRI